jgi:hypothetical protein
MEKQVIIKNKYKHDQICRVKILQRDIVGEPAVNLSAA